MIVVRLTTMRTVTYSAAVQFYAPPRLVADVRAKAEREGRSISEVIREALRHATAEAA